MNTHAYAWPRIDLALVKLTRREYDVWYLSAAHAARDQRELRRATTAWATLSVRELEGVDTDEALVERRFFRDLLRACELAL